MEDEDRGRSGTRAVSVTNDDSLTPTQRFARAIQRRDALIRGRERRDSAGENHGKRRRIVNPGSAD